VYYCKLKKNTLASIDLPITYTYKYNIYWSFPLFPGQQDRTKHTLFFDFFVLKFFRRLYLKKIIIPFLSVKWKMPVIKCTFTSVIWPTSTKIRMKLAAVNNHVTTANDLWIWNSNLMLDDPIIAANILRMYTELKLVLKYRTAV
jgi:hypothetical protein